MLLQRICLCAGIWCHTVILSLSPGSTARFLKHNTLNSQGFTFYNLLVVLQPQSSVVCTDNSNAEIKALKWRGEGFLMSSSSKIRFKPATLQSRAQLRVYLLGWLYVSSITSRKGWDIKQ